MRWHGALMGATAMAGAVAFTGCSEEPVQPRVLPTEQLQKALPPISGGTLTRVSDGIFVAADPDTDQIHVVDVVTKEVRTVDLEVGDEPGRVLAAGDGRVYVALRQAGAVVALNVETLARERLEVCPSPRGMALQGGSLHVACTGGELVTVDAQLEGVTQTLRLERDLRDVVARPDGTLAVSVFRKAELLLIDPASGEQLERIAARSTQPDFEAAVAWRTLAVGNEIVMLHQEGTTTEVPIDPRPSDPPGSSPYGGPSTGGVEQPACGVDGILHSSATVLALDGVASRGVTLGPFVLPVDMATTRGGDIFAAVGAGSDVLVVSHTSSLQSTGSALFNCPSADGIAVPGEPVAVAFANPGEVLVQRRQPAGIAIVDLASGEISDHIDFGGPTRRDVGHLFFHHAAAPSSPIACASCHPEGRDDGRVWSFEGLGARRTQTVSGGILETGPLHWDGEFEKLGDLMGEVFVERMGGTVPNQRQVEALGGWMQSLPILPPSDTHDPDAVARGAALYHDATVGCADCHNGAKLTNGQTVDVGTGQAFQVPALVGIADRAPFMHDGCAPTLMDRFDPSCGGGDQHGMVSHLDEAQLAELVAYLETL